jgi:hypothetical protein
MNAFTFGQSLAPCFVGLLLGLGFIKWKWKLKLLGKIKLVIFLLSTIISSVLVDAFIRMTSTDVVIPVTIAFMITLFFGFVLRKKEIDLSNPNIEGVNNEQT